MSFWFLHLKEISGVKLKLVSVSYLSIQVRLESFLLLSAFSNNGEL